MSEKYSINSVINYLRRSRRDVEREKRTGEDTLTEQKKLMDKVLENMGVPFTQEFEIESGDKISSRPVFSKILEELKEGKYDAIAVKEISRLGRGSMTDMGDIYDTIVGEYSGKGIYIITPHRVYDPKNNGDLRQIRFEMFFAREEFETTRERLVGARHSAAMEGKWMGFVPFGYKRNSSTMRLEPVEEEAKVIRLIFDLYVNGINGRDVRDRALANYLSKIGVKTPGGKDLWYTSQIQRILTNEVFIGTSKFRTTKKMNDGTVVDRPVEEHIRVNNAHEPIIDESVFYDAQEKRKKKAPSRTNFISPVYELTGLLTCTVCGKRVVVNSYLRRRASGKYRDTYLKCSHECFSVSYKNVENKITNLLSYLIKLDSDMLYNFYKKSVDTKPQKNKVSKKIIETIEQKKKSLEGRLQFIQAKHFDGVYSDEDYLMFKTKIENELKEAEGAMKIGGIKEQQDELKNEDATIIKREISDLSKEYDKIESSEVKNKLLRSLFKDIRITIIKVGTKSQEAQIELDVTLKRQFWDSSLAKEEGIS